MADPAYIVNGTLTDGEAWVGISTATPSSADVSFVSTDDGQVGDFSQYMDLVIISYSRSAATGSWKDIRVTFNNDTTYGNYSNQHFYGNGTSAAAAVTNPAYTGVVYIPGSDAAANVFSVSIHNIFDINSGKHKSVIVQSAADNSNPNTAWMQAGVWKSQAAITEIDLTALGTFAAGSMISLFGILPRMVTA
jgi:hypothetical protein